MSSKRKRSYDKMISYAPFWRTLHRKNLTQYDLVAHMSISCSMMQRLRSDAPISLKSVAMLCDYLDVVPSEIFTFLPEEVPTLQDL